MDEELLRTKLAERTTLVQGNVAETVPHFVQYVQQSPIGFAAFDLDFYSSTVEALRIFTLPGKQMLSHVPLYFDDVTHMYNHCYAGELLAIREFNSVSEEVRIDYWRGISHNRAFPESTWLTQMYVAHDLATISKREVFRESARLDLPKSRAAR